MNPNGNSNWLNQEKEIELIYMNKSSLDNIVANYA